MNAKAEAFSFGSWARDLGYVTADDFTVWGISAAEAKVSEETAVVAPDGSKPRLTE